MTQRNRRIAAGPLRSGVAALAAALIALAAGVAAPAGAAALAAPAAPAAPAPSAEPAAPAAPAAAAAPAAPAAEAARRLHALFDDYWERTAHEYPEWATWRGDHRFDDRLTDAAPAARDRRDAQERDWLARAEAIDAAALAPTDRVSREIFIFERRQQVDEQAHPGWRTLSLAAQGGFQTELFALFQIMPMDDAAQARNWLARLAAVPARTAQELHWLEQGIALGWVPARPVLRRVLAQIDAQLAPADDHSPFVEPLRRLGSGIAPAEQAALRAQALQLLRLQVRPAWQRLRDFVAGPYLGAAPAAGGLGRYPGGAQVYALLIRQHTTQPLGAQALHQTGLQEVERLQREIERAKADAGFAGSADAWIEQLTRDPQQYHASADALLAGYRDIAKRIDPQLPGLFAELPRAPYGVRAMPAHLGAGAADYYESPDLDGRRPGWFNVNALAWPTRPRWGMEALVAHETVPGHHLQIARAVELGALPAFRRDAGFTAFTEGWALYAESLGPELGLYRDPASRFGFLQMQIWRAARLVVDTGLHALGWSRERAVDVLCAATRFERSVCEAETDRYLSWPAQALAYTTGQMAIVALRDRARAALGERFDLRRFHNAVLDQGSVPLPVLEAAIDDWIAQQQR